MYESIEKSGQWKEVPNRYNTTVEMLRYQIGGVFSVAGNKAKYLGLERGIGGGNHVFIMQENGQYKDGTKVSVEADELDTYVKKVGDWKRRR